MKKDDIFTKIKRLKENSGTHSPSIDTLLSEIPDISIKVDACFLSNPYATELFMKNFNLDLIESGKLKDVLEFYPPQNREVAKYVSSFSNVPVENIFVGNGAIEIIQAILHRYVSKKVCIILPTFSSYYEFLKPDTTPVYYYLNKDEKYVLDVTNYVEFVKKNDCDTIILINPNNPNGAYVNRTDLQYILNELSHLSNIILDESFIHFAYEDLDLANMSFGEIVNDYPNLTVIKSMSKDFGIAGIRCGYSIMNKSKVDDLLDNGYLWNISGLASYFFKLYAQPQFQKEYEVVRKKYIMNTMMLISQLSEINSITVYPSRSNFVLIELPDNISSFDFTIRLLLDYGVYVRDCSDKIGLEGNFIRLASRSFEENLVILDAIKQLLSKI